MADALLIFDLVFNFVERQLLAIEDEMILIEEEQAENERILNNYQQMQHNEDEFEQHQGHVGARRMQEIIWNISARFLELREERDELWNFLDYLYWVRYGNIQNNL